MTGEFHELTSIPSPWETAAAGLRMIADSELLQAQSPYQRNLLIDAEGFLDELSDNYQDEPDIVRGVHTSLILYGIRTNNRDLIENSLQAINGFDQFNCLLEIRFIMREPHEGFAITDDIWRDWFDLATETAEREDVDSDQTEVDRLYTSLAQVITGFAVEVENAADVTKRVSLAHSLKDELYEKMHSIGVADMGRLESQIGRRDMIINLLDSFNQICGEAGIWQEMIGEWTETAQLFYKAKTGKFGIIDRAQLDVDLSSKSEARTVSAAAIAATIDGPLAEDHFKAQIAQSTHTIFDNLNLSARAAFRWANRELWAYSVGRPEVVLNNREQLDALLQVGRPEFAGAMRRLYAEDRAVEDRAVETLGAFDAALHMTRGEFLTIGDADLAVFRDYQGRGDQFIALFLRFRQQEQAVTDDAGNSGIEVFADWYDEFVISLTEWAHKPAPQLYPSAELVTMVRVLEASLTPAYFDSEVLQLLHKNVKRQWQHVQKRRSLAIDTMVLQEHVEKVLEEADTRIPVDLTEQRTSSHEEERDKPFIIAINPELGEEYL